MASILRAYARALRSLSLPPVLGHFIWPVLVSAAAWTVTGILCWDRLAHVLVRLFRNLHFLSSTLAPGQPAEAAVAVGLKVVLYLLSIPLALATALLILESVALPFILDQVSSREYPRIERRRGGSQWQSLRNTLVSFAIAAAIAVATLPLWLLPGAGVVVSLGLSAWLSYRSFRYDALMTHADAQELRAIPAQHRGRLLLLALGAGTLTLVPVVNLLAVPFAGLSFTHYLLHALARSREPSP
jgi:CysZ protein